MSTKNMRKNKARINCTAKFIDPHGVSCIASSGCKCAISITSKIASKHSPLTTQLPMIYPWTRFAM